MAKDIFIKVRVTREERDRINAALSDGETLSDVIRTHLASLVRRFEKKATE